MSTLLDLDLARGAFGVDKINHVTVLIKPVGVPGKYVGYCHVFVTRAEGGTMRRTLKGVPESEVAAWLLYPGAVRAESVEWYPADIEPMPDTYRADKYREEAATL